MPTAEQMRAWANGRISSWFFARIVETYGNIDREWRTINTIEQLAFKKGQADVLDFIKRLIEAPETFVPQPLDELKEDIA